MSFHIYNRWGHGEDNPTIERMREVLGELDVEDEEHNSASLTHDSEWCLEAFPSGLVIWGHLEGNSEKYLRGVSREKILELWIKLSKGEIAAVDSEPWQPYSK
jgi:hypothetical protein